MVGAVDGSGVTVDWFGKGATTDEAGVEVDIRTLEDEEVPHSGLVLSVTPSPLQRVVIKVIVATSISHQPEKISSGLSYSGYQLQNKMIAHSKIHP